MKSEINSLDVNKVDGREQILGNFGKNLKAFMEDRGVNSVVLHDKLGISTGTVSKIINGNCNPGILTVYGIVNFLNIKIDDLFTEAPALCGTEESLVVSSAKA